MVTLLLISDKQKKVAPPLEWEEGVVDMSCFYMIYGKDFISIRRLTAYPS